MNPPLLQKNFRARANRIAQSRPRRKRMFAASTNNTCRPLFPPAQNFQRKNQVKIEKFVDAFQTKTYSQQQ
jgi:hypothetical protein